MFTFYFSFIYTLKIVIVIIPEIRKCNFTSSYPFTVNLLVYRSIDRAVV
nr:MAG TPA: hypothetical protein [Caudoviricetes sp.]DAW18165.1 MAG TPA: hypothetical protein [Caudoviricetes sp.]